MDTVTIFDSNCRKYVLFDKQIVNLRLGTILNYFRLIIEKDDRNFKLTPEFSKVGGVS